MPVENWLDDLDKVRETAAELHGIADELQELGRPAAAVAEVRSGARIADARAAALEAEIERRAS